jgi:predicted PurR-regulated permease PerM
MMAQPSARSAFRVGLMLALAVAALAGAWLARQEILLGLLAVLVAVVFSFPVGWLSRVVPRGVAVLLVLALVGGGAAGLSAAAAPTLVRQFNQLTQNAPRALRQARRWLERVEESSAGGGGGGTRGGSGGSTAEKAVTQAIDQAKDTAVPALVGSVTGITAVVLVLVLAAFLVHGPDDYRRGVRRLVPPAQRAVYDELWGRLGASLRRWVGGILVAMTIMGTLTALGLLAVGIEDWLLLGVLTFLGTFVPYLGAVASAVPGVLLALAQSPRHFLLALVVYLGVHVVEGYIVEPFVMKRAVEVKPALLLFGQGVIGAIFGPLGVVVATPIIVCTQVVLDVLWVERRLHERAA